MSSDLIFSRTWSAGSDLHFGGGGIQTSNTNVALRAVAPAPRLTFSANAARPSLLAVRTIVSAPRLFMRAMPSNGVQHVLNFSRPWSAGNTLRFGSGEVQISTVNVALRAVAHAPRLTFRAITVRPSLLAARATVYAPQLVFRAWYDNRVQRVLSSAVDDGWERAAHSRSYANVRWQEPIRNKVQTGEHWQTAMQLGIEVGGLIESTRRQRQTRASGWQCGIGLALQTGETHHALLPAPLDAGAPWQHAFALHLDSGGGYVVLVPMPRSDAAAWSDARALPCQSGLLSQIGQPAPMSDCIVWDRGRQPAPGREPDAPVPPVTPPFSPSTILNFVARWLASNDLYFGGRSTSRVPVRRVYIVSNSAQIVRLPGREPVPARSVSLSIDADSWAWSMSATLDYSALALVMPGSSGPVAVEITINGVKWVALVENYRIGRTHGKSTLNVTGRSEAAYLAAPYASPRTYAPGVATARQLAETELTRAGLITGFTLDWNIDDWLVPEGAWSCQNMTPVQVINRIAEAAGAYVNAHPSTRSLIVRPRYSLPPWQWGSATMDKILPPDVLKTLNLQWQEKPLYNAVYLAGERNGIVGNVKRTGTAGDLVAQTVVDSLITAQEAARQRGTAILSDTGRQALVSLEMPLMDSIGLLPPGKMVEIDEADAWRGLVRSTGVSAEWGGALTVAQTIEVERHYA